MSQIRLIEQKVGRNLLLFQKIELNLKYLLAFSYVEVRGTSVTQSPKIRREAVCSNTLGQVAKQYEKEILRNEDTQTEIAENTNEPLVSFRLSLDQANLDLRTIQNALETTVKQRNTLVHSLLSKFGNISPDNSEEVSAYLDLQYQAALPLHEDIRSQCAAFQCILGSIENLSESAFEKLELRQHPLAARLAQISQLSARKDGWAYINVAGQQIQKQAPEEYRHLKNSHDWISLKAFIEATGIFDLKREPTKFGHKELFRLNEEWEVIELPPVTDTEGAAHSGTK